MFQASRHLEKALAIVTSELTDLRDQYRREREAWDAERKELLDRIMALTSPGAMRQFRQPAKSPPPLPKEPAKRRVNFPGVFRPDTRPPSRPPGMSDEELLVVKAATSED
jgi:hypothetical protein